MPPASGRAPGKIILFGEHAVVYGRPALAIPLHDLQASVEAESGPPGQGLVFDACDLGRRFSLRDAPDEPLAVAGQLALDYLNQAEPDATLRITSQVPPASGLGSGAAVSAALMRALAAYFNQPVPPDALSSLVYEVEKLYHGTPSGIDNTVVVTGQPVYFRRNEDGSAHVESISSGAPLDLLVADTGVTSPTKDAVGDVRKAWQANPPAYEALFDEIGALVERARQAIERGDAAALGPLMGHNQELLRKLGVSSPEIEALARAALAAGALGAKLSGAGRGGNVILLVTPLVTEDVRAALRRAGATRVFATTLPAS